MFDLKRRYGREHQRDLCVRKASVEIMRVLWIAPEAPSEGKMMGVDGSSFRSRKPERWTW